MIYSEEKFCKKCEWYEKDDFVHCQHYVKCEPRPGLTPTMYVSKLKETKKDMVNHPSHYEREGAIECIDEMLMIFGKEKVKAFCLCNAWKYRYRAADKNGMEDIKKSDWYMKKYKELDKPATCVYSGTGITINAME